MVSHSYAIRNYHSQDFEAYARLRVRLEMPGQTGQHVASSQALVERLERPGFSPAQDLFVVETMGEIVAYLEIIPEVGIGRVILDCLVHPEHRRRGLASRLTDCAMRRALELGTRVAHTNVREDNEAATTLLSKLGFGPVRRFLEFHLDLNDIDFSIPDSGTPPCTHLKHGEEDKLTRIQNRCFDSSWGYNPNTVESITYCLNLTHCCPEDVILLSDNQYPIAYCWTRIEPNQDTCSNEGKGRIYMIGVDPDYRGRGIGRQVLLAGLRYLKSKDLVNIELTVDSENVTARALYQSLGFEIRDSSLWYEKSIR